MKKLLLLLICSLPCFASIEYALYPKCTFVTNLGNPLKEMYQFYSGHCYRMEFDRFEIYEKQDSKYKHHRTVYKGNEWTRKYILCDKKKRLSIHHAYFGLGSFFDTAKQFDIQDEYENKIGSIQGYFFTCCPAEFYFYKENGELFGVAQLDPSWAHLTVKDANEDVIYTCDKTFHFNVEEKRSNFYRSQKSSSTDQYHWTITYDDRFEFDSRFFWPFLCFISEVWWPGITE